jgi:RND family efflux transporter MFP subunit
LLLAVGMFSVLSACQRNTPTATSAAAAPPVVRTAVVAPAGAGQLRVSGTVRARVEAPLAFQVGGRILTRQVDAGQAVVSGQVLFTLDPIDLEQSVRAAEAESAAARSASQTAQADLERARQLLAGGFVSSQALERAELAAREAQARREAAEARLAEARNALGYARLRSPAAGVLMEVSSQPGQVVAPGQPVALLAQHGEREVEVYFPDGVVPPPRGEALLPDGQQRGLRLREAAPVVEPTGRTRRARYTAQDLPPTLPLGSVVGTRFPEPSGASAGGPPLWRVPIGALDERGLGPRVWRLRADRPEPVPVTIHAVDDRQATVSGALQADERVVALGAHLLHEGMTVRVAAP